MLWIELLLKVQCIWEEEEENWKKESRQTLTPLINHLIVIEALWCEQQDLFYWETLNSKPITLTETDPISVPEVSRLIFIAWEQIFMTTWVMHSYRAKMFFFSIEDLSV